MASKYIPVRSRQEKSVEGESSQKAKWNDFTTGVFLDICLEEIAAGNRPHAHFTKEGCKNIITKFCEKTGYKYDHKQLKNRWDSLKSYFTLWAKLVENRTGLGWDPVNKTVEAPPEFWETRKKENPHFLKFRYQGLLHLDKLEGCFKDMIATGYVAMTPYADSSDDFGIFGERNDNHHEEGLVEGGENFDDFVLEETNHPQQFDHSPDNLKKKKRGGLDEKRFGKIDKLQRTLDRLVDGITTMSKSKTTTSESSMEDPYSLKNCLSLLDTVPGLQIGSTMYFIGSRILAKSANRTTFVHFMQADPALTFGWLSTFTEDDLKH